METFKLRKIQRYGIWAKPFRNNVAEHCFHMIILADRIIDCYKWELDFRKVVRYIYLHDWGEIGKTRDICAPDKMKNRAAAKSEELAVANESFAKMGFEKDKKDYEDYNNLINDEARFVTALDKLECGLFILSNGLDKMISSSYKDGKFRHKSFMSREQLLEFETNYPKKAIAFYPPLKEFADALVVALKKQVGYN